jgi:hypothetical protein
MSPDVEQAAMRHLQQRLSLLFPGVDPSAVAKVVNQVRHRFDACPDREVVPVLVEDAAHDLLRQIRPPLRSTDRAPAGG